MEDILNLVMLGLFGGAIALDFLAPARSFPKVRFWKLKGLLFFVIGLGLSTALPLLWGEFFQKHALLNLSRLGLWGAGAGFVTLQFFGYCWHRAQHNVPALWRMTHQMHHSAERIDVYGAFYFHPLDVAAYAFIQSVTLLLLGVTPDAGLLAGTIGFFYAVFQHSNVKTPAWLGYLIQRPESHCVHHERGVHAYNYADFPLWDIVFGTFRNPARWQGEAGFSDGASARVGTMLVFRDVSGEPEIAPRFEKLAATT